MGTWKRGKWEKKYLNYEDIKEELETRTVELRIQKEYLKSSVEMEEIINSDRLTQDGSKFIAMKIEKDYIIDKIIKRAIFLEGLYNKARLLDISPKYIQEQLEPTWKPYDHLKRRMYKLPKSLEKMDKKSMNEIIKKAKKSQKKETGLISRLHFIVGGCILLSGLFFLSSNITGNAIGNITKQTSTIIGTILFVTGLIATFFCVKKIKKNKNINIQK